MKKRNITLFTAIAAAAAFAPAAQAAIVATGDYDGWARTETGSPVNWDVTGDVTGRTAGTIDIDGGSVLDANAEDVWMGSGGSATGTITVTGSGSKFVSTNILRVGRPGATGTLNVENGGWADLATMNMNEGGAATVTVTGANSILSASTKFHIGHYTNANQSILTVESSGLAMAGALQFGLDGPTAGGYVHMGVGGVLAIEGEHTTTPFVSGGLFTITNGYGEIRYDAGSGFVNMNGAAVLDTDYTLTYAATGGPTVNGQDLSGYTVLTIIPEPSSMSLLALGGLALLRRRRA